MNNSGHLNMCVPNLLSLHALFCAEWPCSHSVLDVFTDNIGICNPTFTFPSEVSVVKIYSEDRLPLLPCLQRAMLLWSPPLVCFFFISHLCFWSVSIIFNIRTWLEASFAFSKWLPDEQGQIFPSLMLDFLTSTHASAVCTSVCFPGFCWISADVFRSARVKCTSPSSFSHTTQFILQASSLVSDCSTASEHQMAWDPYYACAATWKPRPLCQKQTWKLSKMQTTSSGVSHSSSPPGLRCWNKWTQLSLESVSADPFPILNRTARHAGPKKSLCVTISESFSLGTVVVWSCLGAP